jgi:hypothetical protein
MQPTKALGSHPPGAVAKWGERRVHVVEVTARKLFLGLRTDWPQSNASVQSTGSIILSLSARRRRAAPAGVSWSPNPLVPKDDNSARNSLQRQLAEVGQTPAGCGPGVTSAVSRRRTHRCKFAELLTRYRLESKFRSRQKPASSMTPQRYRVKIVRPVERTER